MSSRRASVLMRFFAGLLPLVGTPLWAQSYIYTDLGTLGGHSSFATAINSSGQVVGYSATTGFSPQHAFLYSGGTMTDLGTLGGSTSQAYAINSAGEVTGMAMLPSSFGVAFLYSGGTMTNLGNLGGTSASGTGINNSGLIVGTSNVGPSIGIVSSGGAPAVDLGIGATGSINGINSSGQIVGTVPGNAFILSGPGGSMTNIGVFNPAAINDSGVVVGSATAPDTYLHPYSYVSGTATDLGTLAPFTSGSANAINSFGQIVGMSNQHAFVYTGGLMQDLNSLVTLPLNTYLQTATGINDLGQIVGWVTLANADQHAFLLTPIPESSSWALIVGAVGLGVTAVYRRKKDRPPGPLEVHASSGTIHGAR